jgi:enoyl-CoA hydratase
MTSPPPLSTEEITATVDDAVLTLTINRPHKLNAVAAEMSQALVDVIDWANREDGIRCAIITGAGERAFCAGSDIGSLDDYATPWEFRNRADYCDALHRLRKPIIAAINGYAYGGGLETALACDIRLASRSASFAASEIKLGWIGGGGVTALLAHAIGASSAALMLLTGDPVPAEQAYAWGLVSEILEPAALMPRAQALASVIASRPPIAAQTAKANLHAALNMPQEQAMRYERDLQTIAFATDDASEGRRAFAEKRLGRFLGR